MSGDAGTMQSGRVDCAGGGLRGFFKKFGLGRLWRPEGDSTSWYLMSEQAEEGSGRRDSLVVEGRSADGAIIERRAVQGVCFDEATGEELEWDMVAGTEREMRAWAHACKSNEAKMKIEGELGLAVAELTACRVRLGLWQNRAEEAWQELEEARAVIVETRELLDRAYDIIEGAEEQLDAAMLPVIYEEGEEEEDSGVEDEFLEVEESDGEEWDEGQGLMGGGVVAAAANYVPGRWSRLWGWVAGWFGFGGR